MMELRRNDPLEKPRLGIMGGTFDPIHYGHLVAAEMARCRFNLCKVLFIPSGMPPHKDRCDITAADLRFEMIERAIQDNPAFDISALELERKGPSYTVDSLRVLSCTWPEHNLYFITGTDALREIFSWREAEEILLMTEFIGADRPGFDASDFLLQVQQEHPEIRGRIHHLEVPALAISSTDIRKRIKCGQPIRYLLPEPVRRFIQQNGLYTAECNAQVVQFNEGAKNMSTTLYIGNLPWDTTADDLYEFVASYGQVESSRIITDRETGRSRGFGFIEVGEADATYIVEALNGLDFGGRPLTVNEAKPK